MTYRLKILLLLGILTGAFAAPVSAQADDFCTEFGLTPSLDSPFANVPYIFGRVNLRGDGAEQASKKVAVILIDPQQTQKRVTVGKSGNYCFRRSSGNSGTIFVEIDGVEAARRSFGTFGAAQQREDFEINLGQKAIPKFARPYNVKTVPLYTVAAEAEQAKDFRKVITTLKEIVVIDPTDYVAWAKLGVVHFFRDSFAEAETAFRRSIENKLEYTPAWVGFGQLRIAQKQYEAAIEVLKHAASLDSANAKTFQLLGEAYLLSKQGSLGVAALNEALRLDPNGMAECHLQLAHLYQLAGAKKLAANEYKLFLAKVPSYPERQKFDKFIKENPE